MPPVPGSSTPLAIFFIECIVPIGASALVVIGAVERGAPLLDARRSMASDIALSSGIAIFTTLFQLSSSGDVHLVAMTFLGIGVVIAMMIEKANITFPKGLALAVLLQTVSYALSLGVAAGRVR